MCPLNKNIGLSAGAVLNVDEFVFALNRVKVPITVQTGTIQAH